MCLAPCIRCWLCVATESTRASTPQRDQARPNRRAKHAAARPNHDRLRPIATNRAQARLSTPKHDQSRPITTESTRQARLSAPKHDRSRPIATESTRQSRPNRRANHDRIDAPIAIESRNRDRIDAPITTNRRDRIEKSRPNRPNRTTPLHPFLSGERNSILVLSIFLPSTALFYKSLVKMRMVLGS